MAIRIFITGGTFDKEYNELNGELYFKDTHMQELLEKGRCRVPVEIRTLMMIDSLEMTAEDRELIAHQCINCEENRIVITHGTDTMSDTAAVLAQKVTGKTVILTGAMIPIKFGSSDGLFNLSVKRATSVVRILQNQYGLDPAKMADAGRGEYKRIADNGTGEGKATNRRTRIVILPQLDQFFKLLEPNKG